MQESYLRWHCQNNQKKRVNGFLLIFFFFFFFFEKDHRIENFHIRKFSYHKHHRKGRINNLLFHKKEPLIKNKNAESEMLGQRFFTLKSITNIAEKEVGLTSYLMKKKQGM